MTAETVKPVVIRVNPIYTPDRYIVNGVHVWREARGWRQRPPYGETELPATAAQIVACLLFS
jgi:uncharacterized protein (DUF1684 family)